MTDSNQGLAKRAVKDLVEVPCRGGHYHGQVVWLSKGAHTFTYPIAVEVPFWRQDQHGEWYMAIYMEGVYRRTSDGQWLDWEGAR